ncbi:MAG TPA: 4-hydroxy-tetrahydrodipicolinate reductase [Amaricoccus sp.]|uniref:4-hydroxy-tetrahydrodipicolinate reductase n=1 Tax=Amaricoccus sp. TaxID=1872485 RepID=UPI001DBFF428|nr:4-hydroxy-tetrahydrodipicolinate reductase [Amaricoccus sp.]MCC0068256.1 4-hydroxy-tetrahydrodipicolinate reductase [Rhodovulum sp.]HPG23596.1 4-hydroxy-tetrahydrodipicolinate reductase [Amaricoccus sp.]HRW16936.1 4-hydroxy-tetrahydrodipicolinate reductase [Amaricoccus sp.]
MDERVGIAVVGASGRMGRMLIQAVEEEPRARLTGVTERPGHDWIGRDLGACLGTGETGVRVSDDALEVFAVSQAVLDFTTPAATMAHAVLAAQARLTHVIGTTGLERADIERLAAAARHAVIVRAGNMSVGVNLLTVLARRVATALGADYDVEIVEMHHRHKVDAPSGTALMLGDAVAAGRRVNLADVRESGRDGATGPRGEGAIGFASLRGGDVIGEHEVIFAGPGERISLRHVATDRMLFARGAVRAALWGHHQEPGQYNMIDVLGLREAGAEVPDR